MKFLLEFVWCCGPTGGEGFEKDAPDSINGRRSEETRALVSPRALQTITMRRSKRRKRGMASASSSSATGVAEWKPTLYSISEDNVVVVVEEGTDRVVKRKGSGSGRGGRGGGGGSRDVASISSFNEDYRRSNHFTAIPTFSATPFMI